MGVTIEELVVAGVSAVIQHDAIAAEPIDHQAAHRAVPGRDNQTIGVLARTSSVQLDAPATRLCGAIQKNFAGNSGQAEYIVDNCDQLSPQGGNGSSPASAMSGYAAADMNWSASADTNWPPTLRINISWTYSKID